MPCSDGGYSNDYIDRLRALRPLLCEACAELEKKGRMSKMSLDLQKWWKDHKKEDAKRVREEMKEAKEEKDRKALLKKLSPYERSLLKRGGI